MSRCTNHVQGAPQGTVLGIRDVHTFSSPWLLNSSRNSSPVHSAGQVSYLASAVGIEIDGGNLVDLVDGTGVDTDGFHIIAAQPALSQSNPSQLQRNTKNGGSRVISSHEQKGAPVRWCWG